MLEISSGDWPQRGGPDLSGPLTQVTAQSGVRACPFGCWTWLESGGILVGNVIRWLGGSRTGWTRTGSSSFISTTAYCTAEKRRSTRLEGVERAWCSKWHFPILQLIDWSQHLREAWLSTEARFNRAWFGLTRNAVVRLNSNQKTYNASATINNCWCAAWLEDSTTCEAVAKSAVIHQQKHTTEFPIIMWGSHRVIQSTK
jgi:hypothetical protein